MALQWQQPLDDGQLRLAPTFSREPGHRKAARDLMMLSGWRHFF